MLSYHIYNLDTANYQQEVADVVQLSDKGYLLAGFSTHKANNFRIGQLIRTDSVGNQLWIKTYSYLGYQETITSVDLIDNSTILVGSTVDEIKVIKKNDPIYYYHPRFMKVDLDGNILKDTIYMQGFAGRGTRGGGNIFKDRNGGFFHYGQLEQIPDSTYIDDVINFPDYVAHLDDNFRITWMKVFSDSPGHKYIWMVRQLKDNGYLAFCCSKVRNGSNTRGWAVKLDNAGNIVWDNSYAYDTAGWQYFTDAYELADKSIVFTGMEINFKQPSWHSGDVWLLKVDSNGCELPGCALTAIDPAQAPKNVFVRIYPNPVYDELMVEGVQERTRMLLYDVYGRQVYNGIARSAKETIPTNDLPPGNYILQLTDADGKRSSYKVLKQ
ncbi:MAG: T9SS type A sorting domain-containing protein [Bacteroidetes bacterium]|nr:T9SS type A sorting domain-containing protein [Bacteroidota bacterium]